jgi:Mrp family chromosome partitioning ATPase
VNALPQNEGILEIEEALEPGDETKLTDFIMPLRASYDFILIDTPPGKSLSQ